MLMVPVRTITRGRQDIAMLAMLITSKGMDMDMYMEQERGHRPVTLTFPIMHTLTKVCTKMHHRLSMHMKFQRQSEARLHINRVDMFHFPYLQPLNLTEITKIQTHLTRSLLASIGHQTIMTIHIIDH